MSIVGIISSPTHNSVSSPALSSTIKQMTGLLWYNLLSEMNKNGMAAGALGAGGDAFQSMFLWNIAQNDFTKYDKSLILSTIRQIGSRPPVSLPQVVTSLSKSSKNLSTATSVNISSVVPTASTVVRQATKFAQAVWPDVKRAAIELGVPAPAILAQAALETGWGSSAPGNNLFGMKALEGQSSTVRATQEIVSGILTPQNAAFRDYNSPAASVADYVQHVRSSFSQVIGQSTVAGFAQALQNSGYATDSQYASKIIHLAQSPLMTQVLQAIGGALPMAPK